MANKLKALTVNGKKVTMLIESNTAMVRCSGTYMSYRADKELISEGELRERIADLSAIIPLNITKDTGTTKQAGSIGICMTKAGNHMAYMVDEDGNICNTSVHGTRAEANFRAYILACLYNTWYEHEFAAVYRRA